MGGSIHHEYVVLDRGAACLQCKKRKKRCDGVKPICGPCIRFGTADLCEFPSPPIPKPKPSKSPPRPKSDTLRTQIKELEDKIAILQQAITSSPSHSTPSVDEQPTASTSGGPMDEDAATGVGSPVTAWSKDLLHIFLRHRHRCAFHIDEARFTAYFQLHLADGGADQQDMLHPCLVNAVFLLGCYFATASGDRRYVDLEVFFLQKTREELEKSLTAADRLKDFLQATSLVVWYYFAKGRIPEAQYHASGLACFAGACQLNAINPNPMATDVTLILHPPVDDIDLEERISLFWSIFVLDRYSSLIYGTSGTLRDEDVWTPWPRSTSDWTSPRAHEFIQSPPQTALSFLPSLDYCPLTHNDQSYRTLAILLLERATRLDKTASTHTLKGNHELAKLIINYDSARETARRILNWLPTMSTMPNLRTTSPSASTRMHTNFPSYLDTNALALHNTHVHPSTSSYPGAAPGSSYFNPASPSTHSPSLFGSSSIAPSVSSQTPPPSVFDSRILSPPLYSQTHQSFSATLPASPRSAPVSATLLFAHTAVAATWIHLNSAARNIPSRSQPHFQPQHQNQPQQQQHLFQRPQHLATPSPSVQSPNIFTTSSPSSHHSQSPPYDPSHLASPLSNAPSWAENEPWREHGIPSSLTAARQIADLARHALTQPELFHELDMMIGMAWTVACQTLSDEIMLRHNQRANTPVTEANLRRSAAPSLEQQQGHSQSSQYYAYSPYSPPGPQGTNSPIVIDAGETHSRTFSRAQMELEMETNAITGERDALLHALDRLGGTFQVIGVIRANV